MRLRGLGGGKEHILSPMGEIGSTVSQGYQAESSPFKVGGGTIFELNYDLDEFHAAYEELDLISDKGGSGFVKKCRCKKTNKIYACKIMGNRDLEKEMTSRAEFELLNSIPLHPNIVAPHEFIATPSFTYNIMECVEGRELQDYLEVNKDKVTIE